MIFVTVGTQLPFDRLVRTVDEWAGASGRDDVFVQTGPGEYEPQHVEWERFVDPPEFQRRSAECRALVSHAGIGTILTALSLGKPLLVLPRRASLGEHRNEHQLATVERFAARGLVHAASDESELLERLAEIDTLAAAADIVSPYADERLLTRLRDFVDGR